MLEYNIDVIMSTIMLPSVNKNLDNGKTIKFSSKIIHTHMGRNFKLVNGK